MPVLDEVPTATRVSSACVGEPGCPKNIASSLFILAERPGGKIPDEEHVVKPSNVAILDATVFEDQASAQASLKRDREDLVELFEGEFDFGPRRARDTGALLSGGRGSGSTVSAQIQGWRGFCASRAFVKVGDRTLAVSKLPHQTSLVRLVHGRNRLDVTVTLISEKREGAAEDMARKLAAEFIQRLD
ncbi:hypothetical protein [Aeromicrobium sp. NPDC092404]|uniref:hypothetical protein n=1 Tax=Aeromicrobium sp. NPDC092404 TaxID=3154976 RepID=UPI0034472413